MRPRIGGRKYFLILERVPEREFGGAAVKILDGNWCQPGYRVRGLTSAVITVVVPSHSIAEAFVYIKNDPHVGLLVIESQRSGDLQRINSERTSSHKSSGIAKAER